jgi:3'(2'), 5'-bisphosphate nucleotidase
MQQVDTAISIVADACHAARAVQQDLERVRQVAKDDRSPVTVADFAVQAIVAMGLLEHDPDVLIVGEEQSDLLREPEQAPILGAVVDAVRLVRSSVYADDVLAAIDRCDHDGTGARYWALDPIDGTKGFLRGQQYAIALGLIEGGSVTAGVMGCPNLPVDQGRPLDTPDPTGTIYTALAGGGAFLVDAAEQTRRTPIAAASWSGGTIRVCESVEKGHSKQSDTARIIDLLGSDAAPVRLDSQCKYAIVGRGQADAYLRLPTKRAYVEKIWDHAAGSLIAAEAGAIVSDVTGSPLEFTHGPRLEANRGIVCASADLHPRVIDAIARLGIGAVV